MSPALETVGEPKSGSAWTAFAGSLTMCLGKGQIGKHNCSGFNALTKVMKSTGLDVQVHAHN